MDHKTENNEPKLQPTESQENKQKPALQQGGSGGKNDLPDLAMIKGVLITMLGIMLIMFSYRIILQMILFTAGLILVVYGLEALNIKGVNEYINKAKSFLKKYLPL